LAFTIAGRIAGCLKGIATGDAIGKQTEMLSREEVRRWYPHGVCRLSRTNRAGPG
jgi:ADP-ribosylglycohydrolase